MIKTITFSDYGDFGYKTRGKALDEFEEFCHKNPEIEIIKIIKRRRYITNAGNGDEYYDLDVIFSEVLSDAK